MSRRTEKLFVTTLRVRGSGDFPFDMLRYDCCVPKTEEDSYLLAGYHMEPRTVTLLRFSRSEKKATEARWKSFGWAIVEEVGVEP